MIGLDVREHGRTRGPEYPGSSAEGAYFRDAATVMYIHTRLSGTPNP
jgi:hypothetical protein